MLSSSLETEMSRRCAVVFAVMGVIEVAPLIIPGILLAILINGIGRATPFELIEWDNGGLTIRDTTTGGTVELASFGADNRKVFADMLPTGAE